MPTPPDYNHDQGDDSEEPIPGTLYMRLSNGSIVRFNVVVLDAFLDLVDADNGDRFELTVRTVDDMKTVRRHSDL